MARRKMSPMHVTLKAGVNQALLERFVTIRITFISSQGTFLHLRCCITVISLLSSIVYKVRYFIKW